MEIQLIHNKIYTVRGQRVMLDRDLAEMYGVTTGNLNKAVKRNEDRFPEDFMFQLTKLEFDLIFQNGTSNWGGTRKLPFVFTELGVAMLSSILSSKIAIQINMGIMRAFVAIRQSLSEKSTDKVSEIQTEMKNLKEYIEEVFSDYNDINEDTRVQIELINQSLAELQTDRKLLNKPRRRIGFITED